MTGKPMTSPTGDLRAELAATREMLRATNHMYWALLNHVDNPSLCTAVGQFQAAKDRFAQYEQVVA